MKSHLKILVIAFLFIGNCVFAEDGYDLWLRYSALQNQTQASPIFQDIFIPDGDKTFSIIKNEVALASKGMLGKAANASSNVSENVSLIIGTPESLRDFEIGAMTKELENLGPEGYIIGYTDISKKQLSIVANKPVGALYGTFHLLRLLQSEMDLVSALPISESPKITHRILNHWDNLDRTVERGYAGFSIWNWHTLPDYIDPRYIDYARANASIGINGTVLTNVNANALVLTQPYIEKVKALADIFRPYGIKVYLTARFSSPIEIGGLKTADPLDMEVRNWWKSKVKEIYQEIPDFEVL